MLTQRFKNMSIRLRLTLVYSGILALTLIIFSLLLYVTQIRATLNETQEILIRRGELIAGYLQSPLPEGVPLRPPRTDTYVQVRDLNGELIDHLFNANNQIILPLDSADLTALQNGAKIENFAATEAGPLFIYTQRVVDDNDQPLLLQVAHSLEDRGRFLRTMRNILLIGSGVAVGAAFGIGWLLAGWTLRPINRITRTAQAIGTERDFGRRVDHPGLNDEIGQLATTFNDMLSELQAAYLQLEQALHTQRRFVADASHELRTPLTTIRGNLGLLQREPPIEEADRLEILADMVDETERLMRLVNDMLVLARADTKRKLHREPVAIRPLLQDLYHQYRLLTPTRNIYCADLPEVTALADPDALKQVLLILLDNAIKHTSSDATVTLSTTIEDAQLVIQVSDTGPGIEPAHLPHLFDRFYRGDAARTGNGTGLGLAIAKELIEAQHGTLSVTSRPGEGTQFAAHLPLYHD